MIQETVFFNNVLNEDYYVHFPGIDQYIQNLHLLLKNRHMYNIFMITSDMTKIITSMDCGFCGIPISKYYKFDDEDF